MKILHTSDWHFGMPVGTGTYEDCQRHFLNQLYDIIRREQVDAVLCAGDIYDSSVVSADAVALFNDAATTLCSTLGVKFILIPGNHDSAPRLSACRELLQSAGMYVTGRLEREIAPVLLEGGRVAVWPIPFFNRDEVSALFPERREDIRSTETAALVVLDHIRSRMDPQARNIILAHAMIVNAELSESDRSARIGFATAISKDVFHDFDYVALGHIHKPQILAPHIRYSGSPVKYAFGAEENQEKGVVILDTDTMTQRFLPLTQLREHRTVTGDYDTLMAREDADYLRVYLTDRYAGLELQAELREKFPYLLEIYGKSLEDTGAASSLSLDDLQTFDETDIMEKFMAEHFQYAPTEAQRALFAQVLAWSQEDPE